MLLERGDELDALEAAVGAAGRGEGPVVLLEGEAGIGKTTLLGEAAAIGARQGMRVLRATASELDRDVSLAVVRVLLAPLLAGLAPAERDALLAGPAAPAARVLGLGPAAEPAGPAIGDAASARQALTWLLIELVGEEPFLAIVDDVQWADDESLRWLITARGASGTVSCGLLLGRRSGEPGPDALIDRLADRAVRITPRPLTRAGAATVVRERLGDATADALCDACHTATGGNPFLLGELVEAVAAGELPATADAAERVGRLGPAAVRRSVLLRLSRLGTAATDLARAAAVLGADADLRTAREVAGLAPAEAAEAADALARAGVLTGGDPLAFAHPVLRASVADDLGAARAADLHRRAAAVLRAHGDRGDRVAVHLLAAAPAGEAWAARALTDAAGQARRRGAPEDAARFAERALAEPPDPGDRSPALAELGRAALNAGRPDAADHLRAALEAVPARDPVDAAVVADLATALWMSGRPADACAALAAARDRAGATDDAAVAALDLLEANIRLSSDLDPVATLGPRLARMVERADPGAPEGIVGAGLLAYHHLLAARPLDAELRDRLAGGREPLVALAGDAAHARPGLHWVCFAVLHFLGPGPDDGVPSALVDAERRRGSLGGLASALRCRASWLQRAGRLAAAQADAEAAVQLLGLAGPQRVLEAFAVAGLVQVLVERGALDDADVLLARHGWPGGPTGPTISQLDLRVARAALRLAQGRPEAAREDVDAFLDAAAVRGAEVPFAYAPVLLADVLSATGDRDRALDLARRDHVVAEAQQLPGPLARALLAVGVTAEGEEALAALEAAVEALETAPGSAPLDLARALRERGAALRRAGRRREARASLEPALEIAHRCGAAPEEQAVRTELLACGARPRRPVRTGLDALTVSERRVAELAAAGASNPDIARTLVVTRSTVETHLSRVYLKLGLPGREALAGLLGSGPAPATSAARALLAVAAVMADGTGPVARDALVRAGGRPLRSADPEVVVATFASAAAARDGARRACDHLADHGVDARAGVDAGELTVEDDVAQGRAVDAAVRLAREAAPREVAVSALARELAQDG